MSQPMPSHLEDLRAGIYRHYKGPLYLVQGYAHDANAEEWEYRSALHDDEPYFPDGRIVVVYIPLYMADGVRMAVRTATDFFALVHSESVTDRYREVYPAGSVCRRWSRGFGDHCHCACNPPSPGDSCGGMCRATQNVVQRFTYIGPTS